MFLFISIRFYFRFNFFLSVLFCFVLFFIILNAMLFLSFIYSVPFSLDLVERNSHRKMMRNFWPAARLISLDWTTNDIKKSATVLREKSIFQKCLAVGYIRMTISIEFWINVHWNKNTKTNTLLFAIFWPVNFQIYRNIKGENENFNALIVLAYESRQ